MHKHSRIENPYIHYGILSLIYAVAVLTLLSHTLFHAGHNHDTAYASGTPVPAALDCGGSPMHTYKMVFSNDAIIPNQVSAKRCDAVEVANQSKDTIIAAMGPHVHHIQYPGFKEQELTPGQTYTFRLYKAGTFPIHDHDNDNLQATLVVKP